MCSARRGGNSPAPQRDRVTAVDEATVRRAQRGDYEAFRAIVGASTDQLCALACHIARDRTVAQDALQEAFIKAWRDLPALRDPACLFAWLMRLVTTATYDQLRTRQRRHESGPPGDGAGTMEDEVARSIDRVLVAWACGRLPPGQRAIVALHYESGLSLDETAAVLGIPAGTARSRLHAALDAMRRSLEAPAAEPPPHKTPGADRVGSLPDVRRLLSRRSRSARSRSRSSWAGRRSR
jgi:RNA polymerase sigma-70 factor (ECF subfamily)